VITVEHTQESLSVAYVHAVSGAAGVNCIANRMFDYGMDGTFRPVVMRGSRRVESGHPLDCQLKCTKNWTQNGDNIEYVIKTKTTNDLVTRGEHEIGVILILL
jgi:hypothetical protein